MHQRPCLPSFLATGHFFWLGARRVAGCFHRLLAGLQLTRAADCCPQDTIDNIWAAIGECIAEHVAAQKGVELPGLGLFTVLKPAPTSLAKERVPVFVLDKKFARKFDVEQNVPIPHSRKCHLLPPRAATAATAAGHRLRADALVLSARADWKRADPKSWSGDGVQSGYQPGHPLSMAEVALRSRQSLSAVSNIFNIVVQCLGERAAAQKRTPTNSHAGEVSLAFEPLGRLECCRGVCQFLFNPNFCVAMGMQPPNKQRPLSMRGESAPPRSESRNSNGRLSRARDRVETGVPPSGGARMGARPTSRMSLDPKPEVSVAWDDEDREVAKRNKARRSPSPRASDGRCASPGPYAVERGTGRASTVSLTHSMDRGTKREHAMTKKMLNTRRSGASPIPEMDGENLEYKDSLYMNAEQVKAVHRMCRLLDVFAALDKSSTGSIKAHDISVGLASVLGVQMTGPESHALIDFMNKGSGESVTRMEFIRAFQTHERVV